MESTNIELNCAMERTEIEFVLWKAPNKGTEDDVLMIGRTNGKVIDGELRHR